MRRNISVLVILVLLSALVMGCTAYKLATGDFSELQHRVDLLEQKAIEKQQFTHEEKEFLKDLYGSLVFGGRLLGYKEAANMLDRYLKASGAPLKIAESIYRENKKVQQVMQKITVCIKRDILQKTIKSSYTSEAIVVEHKENPRLFYFSNVFVLQAKPVKIAEDYYIVKWRVELTARFPSYDEQKQRYGVYKYFRTPFNTNSQGQIFTIDDGLSHYLCVVGLAKEFIYYAEWITDL
ncbi:MAG: hypothetical protein JW822_14025 [Spirochaetales bacterium]|nr:hypothetical protein [Spirochaetales bacterium]